MLVVPNKLYDESFVEVLYRDKHFAVLKKHIYQPVLNRQSYVAMHAVSFVLNGEQRIAENDTQVLCIKSGEIGFVKKGIYTVTDLFSGKNGFQSYHLYFDDELLNDVLQLFPKPNQKRAFQPCLKIPSSFAISQYFNSIRHLAHSLEQCGKQLFRIKLMEFLALTIAENEDQNILAQLRSFTYQTPQNLRAFMSENFEKPFSVEDYAYLTGRSLSSFRREFKAKFGISPRKWVTQERLKKAKEILLKDKKSVADTAYLVGYENVSHFISAFKKFYGYTPNQIRNSTDSDLLLQ